jgi:DNA modification methylase
MKSHIYPKQRLSPLPAEFQNEDVRYSEDLVEIFLNEFTQPGDVVFDAFAGFGTTLLVAERMGRTAWGVELEPRRAHYAKMLLKHPDHLLLADSRTLSELALPQFDFSITSPPYRNKQQDENPLNAYAAPVVSYSAYLAQLKAIYVQLSAFMKPNARIVLEVANLKIDGQVTTLAWDIATELSQVLRFEGEIIAGWDSYGYGYDHSYCLVFSKA